MLVNVIIIFMKRLQTSGGYILLEVVIGLGLLLTFFIIFIPTEIRFNKELRARIILEESYDQLEHVSGYMDRCLSDAQEVQILDSSVYIKKEDGEYTFGLKNDSLYVFHGATRYLTFEPLEISNLVFKKRGSGFEMVIYSRQLGITNLFFII